MYSLDVLELNNEFQIVVNQSKTFYNTDGIPNQSDWVREPIKKMKTFDVPQMTSPLNVVGEGDGKVVEGYLGYLMNNSNNLNESSTGVAVCSSAFAKAHGLSIHPKNFLRVVVTFSSRKIITPNWINCKDEFLKPNLNHELYSQYEFDSIVYFLFNSASNQSSLRQVDYKGRLWDIKNEFFWMSADKMKELADQNGYDELYNDARTSPDRYVYRLLFGEEKIYDKLSPDAKAVLDKATELVERSMELRQVMANDENHLNSWDAGYAQLKLVWKEYFQEEFKEFRQLYKNLEERMRPLVYELGFLRK